MGVHCEEKRGVTVFEKKVMLIWEASMVISIVTVCDLVDSSKLEDFKTSRRQDVNI